MHPYLVITVPADNLAPHGPRPSAGTMMTTQLLIFLTKCPRLEVSPSYPYLPDDVIQNGRQDLEISHGKLSVKRRLPSSLTFIYAWGCVNGFSDGIFVSHPFFTQQTLHGHIKHSAIDSNIITKTETARNMQDTKSMYDYCLFKGAYYLQ